MLMHRTMQVDYNEENGFLWYDEKSLATEAFEPLSKRIDKKFYKSLQNLKTIILASDFENYIESLISIKLINDSLWLITDSPMHRSLLEHRFVPALKEAFGVEDVRILSQI